MDVAAQGVFAPLSEEYFRDRLGVQAWFRENDPCTWQDDMQSWVVFRYEDCKEVLRNNERYARDPGRLGRSKEHLATSIQTEDPPSQMVLRRRMLKALHQQDLKGIAIEAVEAFISRMSAPASGTRVDLMAECVAPSVAEMVANVLGSPTVPAETYTPISTALSRAMDAGLDPERLPPGRTAGDWVRAEVETWLSHAPEAGMLATLADDPVVGDELERKGSNYLRNTVGGIYNAGFSTSFALGAALIQLAETEPEAFARAAASPNLIQSANEIVRYLSPAQATARIALEDHTIQGRQIRRGQSVVTMLSAANRDPRIFSRPDDLDPDRQESNHLGFAWGPHVCLGAQLALNWVAALLASENRWTGLYAHLTPDYLDTATLMTVSTLKGDKRGK
ncbi:cytochrome P450 [Arthrobacter silvisoli]|uniref:cytochrome P450 n=1 Tax=Arthrobacter silvisoli TaxID=2291022 RepID=UPI000E212B66|nr:cytochrome P450 [Arthrobacter silvisoli]